MIYLAGIPVTERLVLELARRLRAAELHTTAGKLEHATRLRRGRLLPSAMLSLRALATSRRSRHPSVSLCPTHAPNVWKRPGQPCRPRFPEVPQTRMVVAESSRQLSGVAAVGTGCHAEGRGFESLHPLQKPP